MPQDTPMGAGAPVQRQEEMQGQQPVADQKAASPESVVELVTEVHSGMVSLLEMLSSSQAISPEDTKVLAGIVQQYRNFISENLGGGGSPRPQGSAAGNVPVEAGAAEVIPA